MPLRPRAPHRSLLLLATTASLLLTVGCTSGSASEPAPTVAASSGSAASARGLATAPAVTTSASTAAAGGTVGSAAASASASGAATTTTGGHPTAWWPTYHRDPTRAGADPTSGSLGKVAVSWTKNLDGAVYASPLIVGGLVIAATENDTVYALRSGRVVWSRRLGAPVPQSQLPCGNIDPLGITGTPVYDQSTGTVYVAAELSGPIRHTLYAIDVATGAVRWHRSLVVAGMDPRAQQQRGALALTHHTVYVPFGGLAGDCSDYHGWVVGYRTSGTGSPYVYKTADSRAGMWAPSELGVTPKGDLLASVGNSGHTRAGQGYDHSDAILLLSPTLKLLDYFSPGSWAADNAADLDLSSMGPAYLPGGTVFIAGKRGVAYLTSASHLGHIGGQLSTLSGCAAYGGSAYAHGVVYAPCHDGLAAIKVSGHSMRLLWKAPSNITGSPVYAAGAVWTLDQGAGVLYALSRANGHVLRTVHVGATSRFATPAVVHGFLHVPTLSGIVAVHV